MIDSDMKILSGFSSFSSHGGGSSLAGTHWVLSNGAVVTWEGQLISPAPQSTPQTINRK
uniref:Uncharacterized protein n=1 Tax=Candidatus Giovannonibacteria bacterium GW2011_GWF2_42_19 TaxID=1618659 RepID=A0A0G1BNU0_9BACT|nr:MAG: hypothetical protein UV11_C0012G0003 [Candidatus Giovannonibacteria bacterium GW2011_GWF2_42_19]